MLLPDTVPAAVAADGEDGAGGKGGKGGGTTDFERKQLPVTPSEYQLDALGVSDGSRSRAFPCDVRG